MRTVRASAGDPERLQQALDAAESELIRGLEQPVGILVTRVDESRFTLELSDEVPAGTTLERDLA